VHQLVGERSFDDTWLTPEDARAALRDMIRARRFDERAVALQRRGWMSGYPPFRGQEASQVGAAHAMRESDWLVPTYRSNAMQLARGVPMTDLLLFRRGYPEFESDHDLPHLPQSIPVGSQLPHAVGVGLARSYAGNDHAVLVTFGDGATSEGDFHEALNFAGVFDAPVVFLCENNGWAISTPQERQTASDSIAVKAEAYGFDGVQVDGNDPLAVRETVTEALAAAREGTPTLVESLTYRQGAHTTADDPTVYRDDDPDLPDWRTADPVDRFASFCRAEGLVDEGFLASAREAADEELAAAVDRVESTPPPSPDDVFDHQYATLPPAHRAQRARLREGPDHGHPLDE
jgi:pyruvate dehydrogenase E1 component alpha subunit